MSYKLYVDKSQICQEMETNEHSHIHWSKMNRSSQELYIPGIGSISYAYIYSYIYGQKLDMSRNGDI